MAVYSSRGEPLSSASNSKSTSPPHLGTMPSPTGGDSTARGKGKPAEAPQVGRGDGDGVGRRRDQWRVEPCLMHATRADSARSRGLQHQD
ncbi:hypothetical protein ABBQ38_013003 [Trebouxia sp. C0009 RCD-2024]